MHNTLRTGLYQASTLPESVTDAQLPLTVIPANQAAPIRFPSVPFIPAFFALSSPVTKGVRVRINRLAPSPRASNSQRASPTLSARSSNQRQRPRKRSPISGHGTDILFPILQSGEGVTGTVIMGCNRCQPTCGCGRR
jgi:hypothetical protein